MLNREQSELVASVQAAVSTWFDTCSTSDDIEYVTKRLHRMIDIERNGRSPHGSFHATVFSVLDDDEWSPAAVAYDVESAHIIGKALVDTKGQENVRID